MSPEILLNLERMRSPFGEMSPAVLKPAASLVSTAIPDKTIDVTQAGDDEAIEIIWKYLEKGSRGEMTRANKVYQVTGSPHETLTMSEYLRGEKARLLVHLASGRKGSWDIRGKEIEEPEHVQSINAIQS